MLGLWREVLGVALCGFRRIASVSSVVVYLVVVRLFLGVVVDGTVSENRAV